MKALTLTQPWATLVALGAKRYETRDWETPYRGPLAIHAAKDFPLKLGGEAGFRDRVVTSPFWEVLLGGGYTVATVMHLPRGVVIAVAELADVLPCDGAPPAGVPYPEEAFGDFSEGRFMWELRNVRRIEPVPASGRQRLWDLPDLDIVET